MEFPTGQPLNWYLAANLPALRDAFDQIQVAIVSGQRQAGLRPHLLVDVDDHGLPSVARQLDWLGRNGVTVIRHRAEFFGIVRRHFGPRADPYSGHWLRWDIPVIEAGPFAFYTDIDVLFRDAINLTAFRPACLTCAPDPDFAVPGFFNTGVMVLNLDALRATREAQVQALHGLLDRMLPWDDELLVNQVYAGRYQQLPDTFNWKPYWGFRDDAAIVHFQGPKPAMARQFLAGQTERHDPGYSQLFARNPAAYHCYLAEFDRVLGSLD